MTQSNFGFDPVHKKTRKEIFLEEMNRPAAVRLDPRVNRRLVRLGHLGPADRQHPLGTLIHRCQRQVGHDLADRVGHPWHANRATSSIEAEVGTRRLDPRPTEPPGRSGQRTAEKASVLASIRRTSSPTGVASALTPLA